MFSCVPECSKQLPRWKLVANWRDLGHRIDAKISPKAVSEKVQTTVSENRYIYPKIDFSDGHFIASSVNRKQCAGVIFGTPGAVYLCYSLAALSCHACFTFSCLCSGLPTLHSDSSPPLAFTCFMISIFVKYLNALI